MISASNKTQHKLCMKQKHVIQTAVDARYTCNTRHACIIHFTVFKHVFRGLISRQACIMHLTVYGHVFRGPDLDHYDHTYDIVHQSLLLLLLYLLHLHLLHLALHAGFSPSLHLRRVRRNTPGIAVQWASQCFCSNS